MGQKFGFGFSDSLIAEVGGVTLHQLHFDAEPKIKKLLKIARKMEENNG